MGTKPEVTGPYPRVDSWPYPEVLENHRKHASLFLQRISDEKSIIWLNSKLQKPYLKRLPCSNHYTTSNNFFCQIAVITNSVLSTYFFANLLFCQITVLSTCNFVDLLFCQLTVMSTCYFVNLMFSQLNVLSTYCFVNLLFCQLTVLST